MTAPKVTPKGSQLQTKQATATFKAIGHSLASQLHNFNIYTLSTTITHWDQQAVKYE